MKQTELPSERRLGQAELAADHDARDILSRFTAGDPNAAQECIKCYGNRIWAIARKCTESDGDAEEAALEIFRCIWKRASDYPRSRLSEADFISTIAASCMLKYARDRGFQMSRYLDIDPAEPYAETPLDRSRDN